MEKNEFQKTAIDATIVENAMMVENAPMQEANIEIFQTLQPLLESLKSMSAILQVAEVMLWI
jgi:hypothetical protein